MSERFPLDKFQGRGRVRIAKDPRRPNVRELQSYFSENEEQALYIGVLNNDAYALGLHKIQKLAERFSQPRRVRFPSEAGDPVEGWVIGVTIGLDEKGRQQDLVLVGYSTPTEEVHVWRKPNELRRIKK